MILALALVCSLVYVIANLVIANMQLPPAVKVAIVVVEIIFFLFVLLTVYGFHIVPIPSMR